jgi:hypothetical protein
MLELYSQQFAPGFTMSRTTSLNLMIVHETLANSLRNLSCKSCVYVKTYSSQYQTAGTLLKHARSLHWQSVSDHELIPIQNIPQWVTRTGLVTLELLTSSSSSSRAHFSGLGFRLRRAFLRGSEQRHRWLYRLNLHIKHENDILLQI